MIKRRIFLLGLVALGGTFGWRFLRSKDEDAIAAVVYKRLGYLRLDAAGVQQYARDFVSKHLISSRKLHAVAALGPLYARLSFSGNNALTKSADYAEERIITNYLISTDFFTNGADQSRVVLYQGYYDGMRACSNPFRQPVIVESPA